MPGSALKGLLVARQIGTHQAFEALMQDLKKVSSLQLTLLNASDISIVDLSSFDFILTGTSLESRQDSELWKKAQDLQIPCFAFHDQWVNTAERFKEAIALPEAILVVDTPAQKLVEDLNLHLPIHVISSPLWDSLTPLVSQRQKSLKNNLAVFATEPVSLLSFKQDNGFDDLDSLKSSLEVLNQWAQNKNQIWNFEIKLHPIDKKDRVEIFLNQLPEYKNLQIQMTDKSKEQIFTTAQFVFGMRSMFLVEASLAGVPVVSFQPHRKTKSPATDNRAGIETVVDLKEGEAAFEKALKNHPRLPENSSSELLLQFLKSIFHGL